MISSETFFGLFDQLSQFFTDLSTHSMGKLDSGGKGQKWKKKGKWGGGEGRK